jgi:DNA-binding MarR family transcriptional regulator
LLTIAREPGLTMQTLAKRTGLAQSSCSRNVAMLSLWHRLKKPGFDLVESVDDPRERRRKIIFLTLKGQRLVTKAMQHLDPSFELHAATAAELIDRIQRRA